MTTADETAAEHLTSSPSPPPTGEGKGWRLRLARLAAFVGVVALSILISLNREQVQRFQAFGYPGIFVLSFLASATIILPAPGLIPVFSLGTAGLNPWLIGLAAGAGSTLGELSGYAAGFSGQAIIENRQMYDQLVRWMRRYGLFTIFILALIPNPLFDLAGVVSGALRVPLWQFLLVTLAGKTIKMVAVALLGRDFPELLQLIGG